MIDQKDRLKNFIYCRNFTNTVRVCRATLSRRRPALPDLKQDPNPESEPKLPYKSDPDPESDPKQIIPDPQPCLHLSVAMICTYEGVVWAFPDVGATGRRFCRKTPKGPAKCVYCVCVLCMMHYTLFLSRLKFFTTLAGNSCR
jgi:hypothetical protein